MEHDELAEYLESLARDDCYRVDALLSESACEQTQRVYFLGANGAEIGPYVRKVIRRESGLGNAYRRIYDAQRAGRRFKHIPQVLECHDAGEDLVAVMELVSGESLAALVARVGPSIDVAAAVFPPLCDAAVELHEGFDPPIIHRDLKPSNVIVSWASDAVREGARPRCDVTVIDFDISRVRREGSGADTVRFGTPAFAPPEQFGFAQTTERSDVYALGALLFFCLTGDVPEDEVRQHGWADPRVPEQMRLVIAQAAAFDPDDRFSSAAALKQAFCNAEARVRGGGRCQASDDWAVSEAAVGSAPASSRSDGRSPGKSSGQPAAKDPEATRGPEAAKGSKGAPPLAIGAGIAACVAIAAFVGFGALGNMATSSTSSPAALQQSADAQASGESSDAGSSSGGNEAADGQGADLAPLSEVEAASGLQTPGEPKNGFDHATNFTVSTAGVEFEVPSYFKMSTSTNEDGSTSYFAETGSSVAMLMVREDPIDSQATRGDFESAKDAFVEAVVKSSDMFGEITSSTDCELAGRAARVITTRGSTENGIGLTFKEAFFFDESHGVVGAVMFGQTDNVQFDYSKDFAKVVTSAREVGRE